MSKHADPITGRRWVVGTLSWVALGYAWWRVLERGPRDWALEIAVPVVSALVVTVLTLVWVRHNRGIYERKGPRRGLPDVVAPWTSDTLGRRLVIPSTVSDARVVRVDLVADAKCYRVDR